MKITQIYMYMCVYNRKQEEWGNINKNRSRSLRPVATLVVKLQETNMEKESIITLIG